MHHWKVEQVVQGEVPPDFSYPPFAPQNRCHPVEFRKGVRYLVSTSDVEYPSNLDTVAYRYLSRGRVRLAPFYVSASKYPDEYRVTTLKAALRLVAPGALPPTDTVGPIPTHAPPQRRNRRQAGLSVSSLNS